MIGSLFWDMQEGLLVFYRLLLYIPKMIENRPTNDTSLFPGNELYEKGTWLPEEGKVFRERWVMHALGLTHEQKSKIKLKYLPEIPGNGLAWCEACIDPRGKVLSCNVFIATSIKLLLNPRVDSPSFNSHREKYFDEGVIRKDDDGKSLYYDIDTSEDLHLALLVEELHHAQTYLSAGSSQIIKYSDESYVKYLKERNIRKNHPYEVDIVEVSAARAIVYQLYRYYWEKGDKEKAGYYEDVYSQSLKSLTGPLPNRFPLIGYLYNMLLEHHRKLQ